MTESAHATRGRSRRSPSLWSSSVFVSVFLAAACQNEPPRPAPDTGYARVEPEPPAKPAYAVEGGPRLPDRPLKITEVTAASGVAFVHHSGAFGQKWMPETMGSGACFLDADGDGGQDLYLVDSGWFEGHAPAAAPATGSRLYRNLGGGALEDVTKRAGLERALYGQGCAAADYDGDGDQDLFVTALGDNVLWRNEGGRFTDVTAQAGVAGGRWKDEKGAEHPEWHTSAAFADLDGDRWLDLFVAGYVRWSPQSDVYSTLDGFKKGYSLPSVYPGQSCRYYRNRGDGSFEDRTEAAGFQNPNGKSLGVAVADFNADGRPDVFVTNDTEPNFLYMNQGGGIFRDEGVAAGVAYDEAGRTRAGMGVDVAPLGPGQRLTVAIGNFSNEPTSMYQQQAPGVFLDVAGKAQISRASLLMLTFGVLFHDLDLDGNTDLLVANGHLEPDIGLIAKDITYRQPLQVFLGAPDGRFREAAAELGPDLARPVVGRGLAVGDIDRDGDADLVLTENGGPAHLFRVDGPPPAGRLRLRLRGSPPNTDAIGATVRLLGAEPAQQRFVRSGSSYLSQSELPVVFALASDPSIAVDVEVLWPGQTEPVRYERLRSGRELVLDQDRGVLDPPAEPARED